MNVHSVAIYEFSTGIKFNRLNDGGWVSRGFSGEYMNSTIDPVPLAVERSISNREFRIAEGTASEDPAVVGRVVGEGVDSWSVVAIISRGEDERGRGVSFYRYFLAKGTDKIPYILEWLEQDKQNRNPSQIRIFNPLDIVNSNQPYISTVTPPTLDAEKLLDRLDDEIPVILDNKIPRLIFIHALTIKKVELEKLKGNDVPVAWAFNVKAVEQVKRFTVIRAANDNALDLLKRAKASADKALPLELFDEQSLKSACTGITNSSSTAIKPKYVRTFTEVIGNQAIGSTHWEKIFDGLGANSALKQKIYTSQTIKLIVIRALAIPSTLPQYLSWRAGAGKNNNVDVESTAKEFELELKRKLKEINNQSQELPPAISSNIVEGFGTVLSKFLNDDSVSLEAIASLLKDRQGLWGSQSRQFIDSLDRDLDKMHGFANPEQQNQQRSQQGSIHGNTSTNARLYGNPSFSASVLNSVQFELKDESWQKIWRDIAPFWINSPHPNKKYTKFAELFEDVGANKIALIFYHISEGTLSPQRFRRLANSNKFGVKVYGVIVKREKSFSEEASDSVRQVIKYFFLEDPLENNSRRQEMKRYLTIGIVGLSFIGGIAFRSIIPTVPVETKIPPTSASPGPVKQSEEVVDYQTEAESRDRLIKNIENIYELKKILEADENDPSADPVSQKILEKFGITKDTNLDQLSKIINQMAQAKGKDYIKKQLNSWNPAKIAKTIGPIDKHKEVNNKALKSFTQKGALKTIKAEIMEEWQSKKSKKPIG